MNSAYEMFEQVKGEIDKVVKGKDEAKKVLVAAFLARGNVLLEGVPGMGKTLLARACARIVGLGFSRIQFTPDLMPSDILGTNIYNQGSGRFEFVPGPIFTNFILADEINRAPAKTQAALLEAMEEHQVTIDNRTYDLPGNFIVFATQNPLEFEGTYMLPEAQTDRFMVRILMDYPTEDEEFQILRLPLDHGPDPTEQITPIENAEALIAAARQQVGAMVVDEKIVHYVRSLVRETRNMDEIALGNSPRAGQMLLRLAAAYAAIEGSGFVTPDHVRELVPAVLPHRWILKPETQVQQQPVEDILRELFNRVAVPT